MLGVLVGFSNGSLLLLALLPVKLATAIPHAVAFALSYLIACPAQPWHGVGE